MPGRPRKIARLGILSAAFALAMGAAGAAPTTTALTTGEKRSLQRETRLIIDLLQDFHYADRPLHEIEGAEIVARFLHVLEPEGIVLTRADVDFLHRRFDRSLKTVYLLKGDVQPAFEMFDFFATRVADRIDWIERRLATGLDLSLDDELPALSDRHLAGTREEVDRLWERLLKNAVIEQMLSGRDQAAATIKVLESYQSWGRRLAGLDAFVVRERFLDMFVGLFDPHSGYSSADSAREFAIEMEGAVAGVGLDLRKEHGECVVTRVIPGGPAEEQGAVLPGDRIIGIADGDGPRVETSVLRLREIVEHLRGEPGTVVHVFCTRPGSDARLEAVLTRKRVVLPDQRARGGIVTFPGPDGRERTIGWIDLPAFYGSSGDEDASSATRDVRELLDTMKGREVESVVFDLRKNPGGTLTEAVSLVGLFIPSGTAMVTRGLDGTPTLHQVEEGPVAFSGPVVLLTSRQSASASEIMAGALRFHHRALVVGDATTFGKGTVQAYIDLEKTPARTSEAPPPWGLLRLTSQRFYFPDGGSVQLAGAVSHLVLPACAVDEPNGEAGLPHALPEDSIEIPGAAPTPGSFSRVTDALVAHLREQSAQRTASMPEFALRAKACRLQADAAAEKPVSLSLTRRREELEDLDLSIEELRVERQALAREVAYADEEVDTAEVRAELEAHESVLRQRFWPGGERGSGHLHGSVFWLVDARGRLRSVSLEAVDFRRFMIHAPALAQAFAAATGCAVSPDEMAAALGRLHLVENRTDADVLACFSACAAVREGDGSILVGGVDAVLQKLTEIDDSLAAERPLLDVPLREALRLAADWLAWDEATPSPSDSVTTP